jgi:hypothetical protein
MKKLSVVSFLLIISCLLATCKREIGELSPLYSGYWDTKASDFRFDRQLEFNNGGVFQEWLQNSDNDCWSLQTASAIDNRYKVSGNTLFFIRILRFPIVIGLFRLFVN